MTIVNTNFLCNSSVLKIKHWTEQQRFLAGKIEYHILWHRLCAASRNGNEKKQDTCRNSWMLTSFDFKKGRNSSRNLFKINLYLFRQQFVSSIPCALPHIVFIILPEAPEGNHNQHQFYKHKLYKIRSCMYVCAVIISWSRAET